MSAVSLTIPRNSAFLLHTGNSCPFYNLAFCANVSSCWIEYCDLPGSAYVEPWSSFVGAAGDFRGDTRAPALAVPPQAGLQLAARLLLLVLADQMLGMPGA